MPRRISPSIAASQALVYIGARSALSGPRCGGPPKSASSQNVVHMLAQSGRPSGSQTNGADDIDCAMARDHSTAAARLQALDSTRR
jgi:hypothetical protein